VWFQGDWCESTGSALLNCIPIGFIHSPWNLKMDEVTYLKEKKAALEMQIYEKMRTATQLVRELEEAKLQQRELRLKILSASVTRIVTSEGIPPKRFWT